MNIVPPGPKAPSNHFHHGMKELLLTSNLLSFIFNNLISPEGNKLLHLLNMCLSLD